MRDTFTTLADQIGDLNAQRMYIQTVEGRILLDATIKALNTARDCLRRAIAAESSMDEPRFDIEQDISDYEGRHDQAERARYEAFEGHAQEGW